MVTPSYQAPQPYLMPARKLSFGEKIKGFLGSPTDTFNSVKSDTFGDVVKYYTLWLVIYSILATTIFIASGIVMETIVRKMGGTVIGGGIGVKDYIMTLVFAIAIGLFALFIGGAWMHLWVWIFGGRKGYENTVKALAYGATPSLLFGWIPNIGLIFGIWALILYIIGMRQLHEIPTGRAIGAVLIAIIIPVCLIVLAALAYVRVV